MNQQLSREEKRKKEAARALKKTQHALSNGIRISFPNIATVGELDFVKALRRGSIEQEQKQA